MSLRQRIFWNRLVLSARWRATRATTLPWALRVLAVSTLYSRTWRKAVMHGMQFVIRQCNKFSQEQGLSDEY